MKKVVVYSTLTVLTAAVLGVLVWKFPPAFLAANDVVTDITPRATATFTTRTPAKTPTATPKPETLPPRPTRVPSASSKSNINPAKPTATQAPVAVKTQTPSSKPVQATETAIVAEPVITIVQTTIAPTQPPVTLSAMPVTPTPSPTPVPEPTVDSRIAPLRANNSRRISNIYYDMESDLSAIKSARAAYLVDLNDRGFAPAPDDQRLAQYDAAIAYCESVRADMVTLNAINNSAETYDDLMQVSDAISVYE